MMCVCHICHIGCSVDNFPIRQFPLSWLSPVSLCHPIVHMATMATPIVLCLFVWPVFSLLFSHVYRVQLQGAKGPHGSFAHLCTALGILHLYTLQFFCLLTRCTSLTGATDIRSKSGVKLRGRMKLSKGTGTLVDPQTEEL